jgi:hypothetical protein
VLLGVKLPPECEDRDESKDCRLLVRALRRMPRRLLFFNNGGRSGFPEEIPLDKDLQGEVEAAAGVNRDSICILLHVGVCGDGSAGKIRFLMMGPSKEIVGAGLSGGVCRAVRPTKVPRGCAIHEPTDSNDDMESLSSTS